MGRVWDILWNARCKVCDIYDEFAVMNCQKEIEKRIKYKSRNNIKINVLFVCHRPAIWGALKSIFEAMIQDEKFNATIVAIPNKKEDKVRYLCHEEYIDEGAEEFFRSYTDNVIVGYDYGNKTWFDLKELRPDFVFFQTPYNICRPAEYNSSKVARYAKLCYVHYSYGNMSFDLGTSPLDFIKYVSFLFADTEEKESLWRKLISKNKLLLKNRELMHIGYPKFDEYFDETNINNDPWHYQGKEKKFRILWTPRWSELEGNSCFAEYKDKIFEYVQKHPDVEVWFRPHPQMRNNMQDDAEWKGYVGKIEKTNNFFLDGRDDYFDTFLHSDVLISDVSGMVAEYMPSRKPIILCDKALNFNHTGELLATGYYFTRSWKEVEDTIEMLRDGDDPLQEKRNYLVEAELLVDSKQKIGEKIKEAIKNAY